MSVVRYLLDEHIDPALRAQLLQYEPEMVVWMIGDPGAPARGTPDPHILRWCDDNGFLLVTRNRASMPVHLKAYLEAGHHLPGILTLNPDMTMGEIIEELRLIWAVSEPHEFRDLIVHLPIM